MAFETPRYIGNGKFTTTQRWVGQRISALSKVPEHKRDAVVDVHIKQLNKLPIVTSMAFHNGYIGSLLNNQQQLAKPSLKKVLESTVAKAEALKATGNEGLYPERFVRLVKLAKERFKL